MLHTIANENMTVKVNDIGAELYSVVVDGKEWIWQNPTGEWAGHAPVLFPVCGKCGLLHEGVEYPITKHGICRRAQFTLAARGEDFLDFTFASSEETKKEYPFDFLFHAIYRIDGKKLTVEYVVENTGDTPLYFACGCHESYNIDKPLHEYKLVYEKEEKFIYHVHDKNGLLTGETYDGGSGTTLDMPCDRLQNGDTVIMKDMRSRKVRLEEKSGKPLAEITYDGFPVMLLWHADNAAYICIEPWTNVPDSATTPDVEFSTKYGVLSVAPKSVKTMVHSVEYL